MTLEEIDQRLRLVEQTARRMRLSKASLLRLQPGDVLMIRVPRALAESERTDLARGFRELFESIGLGGKVQCAIICSHDAVELDVVRAEADGLPR